MSAIYAACGFALGRGNYCTGDVLHPRTHALSCPHYARDEDES